MGREERNERTEWELKEDGEKERREGDGWGK